MLLAGFAWAEEKPQKPKLCFLWQGQSKEGKVYLLGSVHLAKKELYPLNAAIEEAFAESEVLAVEADITKANQAALQAKILQKAMYPAGESLKGKVPEKTFAEAKKRLGLPPQQLSQMRPWYLAMTLSVFEMMKLGYDPQQGIDLHFLNKAKKQKKTVHELESAEFQINLLSSFDEKLQVQLLEYTIVDLDGIRDQTDEMFSAWREGDAVAMEKFLTKGLKERPDLKPVYEKLVDDRNVKMADKIERYLKSGRTHFVVVGAGHLVGEKGLVKLLEARGIHLEQIPQAAEKEPAVKPTGGNFDRLEKPKVRTTQMQIKQLALAAKFFYLDRGKYPNSLEDLLQQTKGKTGKYLEADSVPKDAWQNDFIYRSPGSGDHPFEIMSLGRDGMQGGTGYDADIVNIKMAPE